MSILSVYHVSSPGLPDKVLTHFEDIVSTLAEQGVDIRRLKAPAPVVPGASQKEVMSACQEPVEALMAEHGCLAVEVISVDSHHPQRAELRARFVEDHHHAEDELRWVVAGRGLFSLRVGEFVYVVLCERNDLISIPAGTRQWFDMGEPPHFLAVRLFKSASGLSATFTDEGIADQFPRLDD
jgi:1,2-dihydroxy-3-keto-5-methylthiopentene dioxygenase